jgi:hypothetical protein
MRSSADAKKSSTGAPFSAAARALATAGYQTSTVSERPRA